MTFAIFPTPPGPRGSIRTGVDIFLVRDVEKQMKSGGNTTNVKILKDKMN